MPLYKIIKAFFIPPGIYVTAFFLLAIALTLTAYCVKRHSKNICAFLSLLSLFCYMFSAASYGISTNAGAQRLMRSLEYQYTKTDMKPDAILVLGGSSVREKTASSIYKRYKVDVVPSAYDGGAENMANTMMKLGVPKQRIIIEPNAFNTKDHVRYMLPIALAHGYKRVYLVTSANHMPRSMMLFRDVFRSHGIEVVPYPCGYTVGKEHKEIDKLEWIPNIYSFQIGSTAWSEYLGMIEFKLFNMFG